MKRFWNKVDKSGDCWNWTAGKRRNGYGIFRYKGKLACAHRVSYEIEYGSILDELCVLHKCDNTGCVNPDHLFLGTQLDNMQDKVKKNRQFKGEIHNKTPFTEGDIKVIRDLRSEGCTLQLLGDFFGVSKQAIRAITLRQSWKHI